MASLLNPYQIMWVVVCYDFRMDDSEGQREYVRFRKYLLELGFTRLQYSIYTRHCPGLPHVRKYIQRIKKFPLKKGHLMILTLTDKQFGMITHIHGTGYYRVEKKVSMPSLFAFLDEEETS
jgi:CRISPR-associated protein Cas2